MAELGDLLGTLMVSLVRARQLADEAAGAVAEQYRSHALLEGMSVPRVRVPELTLDLPVILKEEDPGEPAEAEKPEQVAAEVAKALHTTASSAQVKLPEGFAARYEKELVTALQRQKLVAPVAVGGTRATREGFERPLTREGVARVSDSVFLQVARALRLEVSPDAIRPLREAIRARSLETAEKKPGRRPTLSASIVTSEVKESAGAASATRIRITLREEGLEWTSAPASDGTVKHRLEPE